MPRTPEMVSDLAEWVDSINTTQVIRSPKGEVQEGDLRVGFVHRVDQFERPIHKPIVVVCFTPVLPDDDAVFDLGYDRIKEEFGTAELWRTTNPEIINSTSKIRGLKDFGLPEAPPEAEVAAGVLLRNPSLVRNNQRKPSPPPLTRFSVPDRAELLRMERELLLAPEMFPGGWSVGSIVDNIERAIVDKITAVTSDFVHKILHPIETIDNPSFVKRPGKRK